MEKYTKIRKKFEFLTTLYGFKISMKQKHGAYYYIEWTNGNINIMVLYDERDKNPVRIRIYDADSLGAVFDAIEYKNEFALKHGSPQEKIQCASDWLKNAITNKIILI